MATFEHFRSAFNGFHRGDVVKYIELLNNKHASALNQYKTELQYLQGELSKALAAADPAQWEAKLAQEQEKNATLEQELAQLRKEIQSQTPPALSDCELEAYRRAERAERAANERVAQLYAQANGILADATARTDESAANVAAAVTQASAQLSQLQAALNTGKNVLQDAAAALYAVRPLENRD